MWTQQLYLTLLIVCVVSLPRLSGFPAPAVDCFENVTQRKLSDLEKFVCDIMQGLPIQEQTRDLDKRFLFHYSKGQEPLQSMQAESHSVHPLMRLSPKLLQKRKKQQLLRS